MDVSGNLVSPIVIVTGSVDNIKISDHRAAFKAGRAEDSGELTLANIEDDAEDRRCGAKFTKRGLRNDVYLGMLPEAAVETNTAADDNEVNERARVQEVEKRVSATDWLDAESEEVRRRRIMAQRARWFGGEG